MDPDGLGQWVGSCRNVNEPQDGDAMRQMKDRYADLLRNSSDAVVVGTVAGEVKTWNAAAERLFGWTRAEITERLLTRLIPLEDLAAGLPAFRKQDFSLQLPAVHKDGTLMLLDVRFSWVDNSDMGAARTFVAVARDIVTAVMCDVIDYKVASAQDVRSAAIKLFAAIHPSLGLERLALIIFGTQLEEIVVTSATDGPLTVKRSPVGHQLADGWSVDEVSGELGATPLARHLGDLGFSQPVLVTLGSERIEAIVAVDSAVWKSPDRVSALLREALPSIDRALTHVLLIETERLTARRLADEARLRSEFLGMITHELRSPLSGIATGAAALRDHYEHFDRAGIEELATDISRDSYRLSRLIADLADQNRMAQGEFSCELVVVTDLGPRLATWLRNPAWKERGHRITSAIDFLPAVLIDDARVEQIMTNLVSNAVKYSPDGSVVHVTATVESRGVHIIVADHGAGIPHESLEWVFERFSRLGPPDGQVGWPTGLGLGLGIARDLAVAHGGALWAGDSPDRGATLHLTLPLATVGAET